MDSVSKIDVVSEGFNLLYNDRRALSRPYQERPLPVSPLWEPEDTHVFYTNLDIDNFLQGDLPIPHDLCEFSLNVMHRCFDQEDLFFYIDYDIYNSRYQFWNKKTPKAVENDKKMPTTYDAFASNKRMTFVAYKVIDGQHYFRFILSSNADYFTGSLIEYLLDNGYILHSFNQYGFKKVQDQLSCMVKTVGPHEDTYVRFDIYKYDRIYDPSLGVHCSFVRDLYKGMDPYPSHPDFYFNYKNAVEVFERFFKKVSVAEKQKRAADLYWLIVMSSDDFFNIRD